MIRDLNNEDMLHLVNFESKEVKRGIRRGSGPGEAVAIVDLQLKGNDFFIFDPSKQIKYYGPNYTQQGNGAIAWSKEGEVGFCGLDCDDDYVYALYSGRTFAEHGMVSHHCKHLFVYDWDGNPVKRYMLDIPLFSMKYDKENNSIYGIGYNPEGVFVEYQL